MSLAFVMTKSEFSKVVSGVLVSSEPLSRPRRHFRRCRHCPCMGKSCSDPSVLRHCCLSCLSDPLVVVESDRGGFF